MGAKPFYYGIRYCLECVPHLSFVHPYLKQRGVETGCTIWSSRQRKGYHCYL